MDKKTAKSLAVHYHAFLSTDVEVDPIGKRVAALGLLETQEKSGLQLMTPMILNYFIQCADKIMAEQKAA